MASQRTRAKTIKLDIACGQNKQKGHVGIDIAAIDGVDIVHDLNRYPWPIETGSVREAFSSHYVEHIPMDLIADDGRRVDGMMTFMDELWRVCKDGAKVLIVHPYFKCERAFQDPTHRRFITSATWHYFNRDWRKAQALDHYPVSCHFEIVAQTWSWFDDISARASEYQQRAVLKDWDVIADLYVHLKAVKT